MPRQTGDQHWTRRRKAAGLPAGNLNTTRRPGPPRPAGPRPAAAPLEAPIRLSAAECAALLDALDRAGRAPSGPVGIARALEWSLLTRRLEKVHTTLRARGEILTAAKGRGRS